MLTYSITRHNLISCFDLIIKVVKLLYYAHVKYITYTGIYYAIKFSNFYKL